MSGAAYWEERERAKKAALKIRSTRQFKERVDAAFETQRNPVSVDVPIRGSLPCTGVSVPLYGQNVSALRRNQHLHDIIRICF